MAGTIKRIGPTPLTTATTTNLYNNTTSLIYDVVKQINVANKSGAAATFSLYLGATGGNVAGTELYLAVSVPANTTYTFYPNVRMANTDFLVGGASANSALVLWGTTEQFVS